MRQREPWNRPRHEPYDSDRGRLRSDTREDYGQADYSEDYGYDPRSRTGYRRAERYEDDRDFGQADYSQDYGYDPRSRTGYRRDEFDARREAEARREYDDGVRRGDRDEPRSWRDTFARRPPRARRRGTSDHVIWAVVSERLAHERGLDDRDIEVLVRDGEVTLNGTVRSRDDKRRAEDLAELHDVRNVQNNLRVRRGFHF